MTLTGQLRKIAARHNINYETVKTRYYQGKWSMEELKQNKRKGQKSMRQKLKGYARKQGIPWTTVQTRYYKYGWTLRQIGAACRKDEMPVDMSPYALRFDDVSGSTGFLVLLYDIIRCQTKGQVSKADCYFLTCGVFDRLLARGF